MSNYQNRIAELEAQIRAIKAEQDELKQRERENQWGLVLEHIDTLLAFVPEHDRTSCDDSNPINWSGLRCRRCALLRARDFGIDTRYYSGSASEHYGGSLFRVQIVLAEEEEE